MRFLETLLLVGAAIYLAQLAIAVMAMATVLLGLWCLYTRPKEALLLGFGLLVVPLLSSWPGVVVGCVILAVSWVITRIKRRRPTKLLLPHCPEDSGTSRSPNR